MSTVGVAIAVAISFVAIPIVPIGKTIGVAVRVPLHDGSFPWFLLGFLKSYDHQRARASQLPFNIHNRRQRQPWSPYIVSSMRFAVDVSRSYHSNNHDKALVWRTILLPPGPTYPGS